MPATIPVTVTPEEQATLLAQAKAQGVSVDELRGEELAQAFEELADIVSESVPPLSAESLRRENIYSREDAQ